VLLLLGVAGTAAVVALLVGVYLLAEDALAGSVGATTLRRRRFPIGILVSTGIIAGYHEMGTGPTGRRPACRARPDRVARGTCCWSGRWTVRSGTPGPIGAAAVLQAEPWVHLNAGRSAKVDVTDGRTARVDISRCTPPSAGPAQSVRNAPPPGADCLGRAWAADDGAPPPRCESGDGDVRIALRDW
jgi:hypothetical protein